MCACVGVGDGDGDGDGGGGSEFSGAWVREGRGGKDGREFSFLTA